MSDDEFNSIMPELENKEDWYAEAFLNMKMSLIENRFSKQVDSMQKDAGYLGQIEFKEDGSMKYSGGGGKNNNYYCLTFPNRYFIFNSINFT